MSITEEECLDRIKKRNRAGEETITLEYLCGLSEQHKPYIEYLQNILKISIVLL